ncbi:hypothetical protein AGMMS4956_01750 [Bacteroidia bacterium]|nr:hypothetical protein AGMMS4956_01750 [Bacteroidia bacterium]
MAGTMIVSCGSSKQVASNSQNRGGGSPFRDAYEAPCPAYDDEKDFAATGFASGAAAQKGSLQKIALKNAQDMIAMKMKHAVEGKVKGFFESVGSNQGTDVDDQTIGDIDNIILGVANNTSLSCLKFSSVNDKGDIECYTAIKISKKQIVDAVANNLSKNKKAEIRQRAEDFRRQTAEELKQYKGE